jgi:CO/xanthine dehydrogenase FAD-binding subunit
MLPEFELLMPQTLAEALEMLAARAPNVLPIAGGTNVIVLLREAPLLGGAEAYPDDRVLVDVSRLPELKGVYQDNGHIVVAGGTTIAQLLAEPLIASYGAPLRAAAAVLGSPLVRNRATVAGNLVDASPAADTAPPLLALNAQVKLESQSGARWLSLEEFMVGVNQTLRRPDELLTAVRWPLPPPHSVGAFHKIGLRNALACSVVTAAVVVEGDGSGRCQGVRIALGAVAPRPIRAHAAEEALRDKRLTTEEIATAARLSAEATSPIDDVRASAAYRRQAVAVVVRRLLTEIAAKVQT